MKYFIFSLTALILFNSSCKKDNTTDITPEPEKQKQLVSMEFIYPNFTGLLSYKYDSQGRVIEEKDENDLSVYTYSGNDVKIEVERYTENRDVFKFTGKVNNKGQLTEGMAWSNYSLSTVYNLTYSFEYDADGYLTKMIKNDDKGNRYDYTYQYDSKHNMIREDDYTNGVLTYSFLVEYGSGNLTTSKINWHTSIPANTLLGKTGTEMITKYTGLRPDGNQWYNTSSFTRDDEGYVKQQQVTQSSGGTYTVNYIWE